MRATYNWIREYVPAFDGSVEEMCERFTMSGTEVEFFEQAGDDWLIEFAVTSNRPDCLGVLGLARELSAVCGLPLVHPDSTPQADGDPVEDVASVDLEDTTGCPRYTAMIIEGLKIGPSPGWMADRLTAIGLRPINNVVDVTNYVLFEMSHPVHAFDLENVSASRIVVRKTRKGETIEAINGLEYKLEPDMTVIADAERPIAIAGVMGGIDTGVSDTTTSVLLETAYFERQGIRSTSRRLNLSTDSSFRFERGVDPQAASRVAGRCARLLLETAGGTLRSGILDCDSDRPGLPGIPFRVEAVERICGIEVPWERCREIFESLELDVSGDPGSDVTVTPPSWREDLTREIDLVEEVIRIHGLENLPMETGMNVMVVKEPFPSRVRNLVLNRLVASGFSETLTTSFVSEDEAGLCLFAETGPLVIRNAMRADENALRQSLMPSLLRVRKTNQDHGCGDVRIAECTVVHLAAEKNEIPGHLAVVGGLLDGTYREARGVVEAVTSALGVSSVEFSPLDAAGGRLLEVDGGATVGAGGRIFGHVGQPVSRLLESYDLKEVPQFFELRLDVLGDLADLAPEFSGLSRLPAIKRDLAVQVEDSVEWGAIEAEVLSLDLPDLESVVFFDEYRGRQVEEGRKSLAFSLTYRSNEKTLKNEEVDESQTRLVKALREKFAAQIRD